MNTQTDYDKIYAKRLTCLEQSPDYTILSSMNKPVQSGHKISQYIVYTDFKPQSEQVESYSIFVYSPFANVDKRGHSKAEYQSQLLFETNVWERKLHLTVLETLGSESRLAFHDFQNMGFAQLALQSLLWLAVRNDYRLIEGNITAFDNTSFIKMKHILSKARFVIDTNDHNYTGTFFKQL